MSNSAIVFEIIKIDPIRYHGDEAKRWYTTYRMINPKDNYIENEDGELVKFGTVSEGMEPITNKMVNHELTSDEKAKAVLDNLPHCFRCYIQLKPPKMLWIGGRDCFHVPCQECGLENHVKYSENKVGIINVSGSWFSGYCQCYQCKTDFFYVMGIKDPIQVKENKSGGVTSKLFVCNRCGEWSSPRGFMFENMRKIGIEPKW